MSGPLMVVFLVVLCVILAGGCGALTVLWLQARAAPAFTAQHQPAEPPLDERASLILSTILERHLHRPAAGSLALRIELPSDDLKARLIGREGRNIRAFEQATQTDLIIDEIPGAVQISCFDPFRREAARITLLNLILDGRIHPSRIEEIHEETLARLPSILADEAEQEAALAGITGLADEVCLKLGMLKLRSHRGQNVWDHSLECCRLAQEIGRELGFSWPEKAGRAALLHDIGKALGEDHPRPHALAGAEFLSAWEGDPDVLSAVASHHGEAPSTGPLCQIVDLVNRLSAERPGARMEAREGVTERLALMEKAARSHPGVAQAYAVQGGRQVRVLVRTAEISDAQLQPLAVALAARLARECGLAEPVTVVAIREARASETA